MPFIRKLSNKLTSLQTNEEVANFLESIPEWQEFVDAHLNKQNEIEAKPLGNKGQMTKRFNQDDDDDDDNDDDNGVMSLNKMLFKINSGGAGGSNNDEEEDSDSDEEEKELESTTTKGIVFPVIAQDNEEEDNNRVVPENWEDDVLVANYKSNKEVEFVALTIVEPEIPEYHDQFYWK